MKEDMSYRRKDFYNLRKMKKTFEIEMGERLNLKSRNHYRFVKWKRRAAEILLK